MIAVTTAPEAGRLDPTAMYERALLSGGRAHLTMRTADSVEVLPVDRWHGRADEVDRAALQRFAGGLPVGARVLEIGCGPGRNAAHLQDLGLSVLAVDTSRLAVELAASRGVDARRLDALGPLPGGAHAWHGVLLLDGSIGVGADPTLLLCRVRDLLVRHGRLLLELSEDGRTWSGRAALDDGQALSGAFPWAALGTSGLALAACQADLQVLDRWTTGRRNFVLLTPGAGL